MPLGHLLNEQFASRLSATRQRLAQRPPPPLGAWETRLQRIATST